MILGLVLAAAAAPEVQRYAIVIGSDEGKPAEPALSYAERDAERIGDVLTTLGGFRPEDLVLVRGEDVDRVREVFAGLGRRIAFDHPDDDGEVMLFVYYSGHADASGLHLGRSELPLLELKALADAVPADVRVLVVDACRSGELTRLKGAVPAEPFAIHAEDRLDSEGLVIIASSSAGEDAQESERLEGGVFTHHFVAGLLGAADTTGDARVTLNEAYRYGYARTIESTSQAPVVQHPTYAFDLRGRDDLVLTRIDDAGRGGRLVLRDAGTWLVFAADRTGSLRTGSLQAEATVAAGGALTLPAGGYLLRLREPDVVRELEVDVGRGEVVTVGRTDMAAVPYGATVRRGLSERRHAAWAVSAGGGVLGPLLPGIDAGFMGTMGGRVDLEPLSLGIRAHVAGERGQNALLVSYTRRVGLDLEAVRRIDVGPIAPGVGVRLGADWVHQGFVTDGQASPTTAAAGRMGPWLGTDVALSARASIGVSAGVDVELYRDWDGVLASLAVPYGLVEVVAYVR